MVSEDSVIVNVNTMCHHQSKFGERFLCHKVCFVKEGILLNMKIFVKFHLSKQGLITTRSSIHTLLNSIASYSSCLLPVD